MNTKFAITLCILKKFYYQEVCFSVIPLSLSRFLQTHKIGNDGINDNFVFPYIYIFLLYLYMRYRVRGSMIILNMKLDINGYKRIIFQC